MASGGFAIFSVISWANECLLPMIEAVALALRN
jgi:hypothetical protein